MTERSLGFGHRLLRTRHRRRALRYRQTLCDVGSCGQTDGKQIKLDSTTIYNLQLWGWKDIRCIPYPQDYGQE